MKLVTTVDPGGELAPAAANTVAIVCSPPIMIKLSLPVLAKLHFGEKRLTRPSRTA